MAVRGVPAGELGPQGKTRKETYKLSPYWGDKVTGLEWFDGCRRKQHLTFITCLKSLVTPGTLAQGTFQMLVAWRQKSTRWCGQVPRMCEKRECSSACDFMEEVQEGRWKEHAGGPRGTGEGV